MLLDEVHYESLGFGDGVYYRGPGSPHYKVWAKSKNPITPSNDCLLRGRFYCIWNVTELLELRFPEIVMCKGMNPDSKQNIQGALCTFSRTVTEILQERCLSWICLLSQRHIHTQKAFKTGLYHLNHSGGMWVIPLVRMSQKFPQTYQIFHKCYSFYFLTFSEKLKITYSGNWMKVSKCWVTSSRLLSLHTPPTGPGTGAQPLYYLGNSLLKYGKFLTAQTESEKTTSFALMSP